MLVPGALRPGGLPFLEGREVSPFQKRVKEFLAHVQRTYGLTPAEYRALYRAQGGKCYVCRVATGPTRKNPRARFLGVDHDHLTGEVRGLVCTGSRDAKTCNRLIALHNRAQLLRAAAMLSDPPPARAVLQAMRSGVTILPSLVDDSTFDLLEVRGVTEI